MSYYRLVILQVCHTTYMSNYWIHMFNRRVKIAIIHLATYTVLGMWLLRWSTLTVSHFNTLGFVAGVV